MFGRHAEGKTLSGTHEAHRSRQRHRVVLPATHDKCQRGVRAETPASNTTRTSSKERANANHHGSACASTPGVPDRNPVKHLPLCKHPFERGRLCETCGLRPTMNGVRSCSRLVARSEAMRELLSKVGLIATSDAPVVIEGESGTGKEVLARTIHANSHRAASSFVAVNVAALPDALLESELFGHARGAFTGATTGKRGLFEEAAGGTLFLDEIGEMPHAMQAKLLRALQDGEIRRVGETRSFSVDARILCATNVNLRARVSSGQFRSDLYYRLRVFGFLVPPLRTRREDILPLARLLLEQISHPSRRFTSAAEAALEAYQWPGNVRELGNAVQHGAVLSQGDDIGIDHLPDEVISGGSEHLTGHFETLAQVERQHMIRVLESCNGNQAEAARILGIGRTTLWRRMRDLQLAAP